MLLLLQTSFLKWELVVIDYLTEYRTFRDTTLKFTNHILTSPKKKGKPDNEITYIDLDNIVEKNIKKSNFLDFSWTGLEVCRDNIRISLSPCGYLIRGSWNSN